MEALNQSIELCMSLDSARKIVARDCSTWRRIGAETIAVLTRSYDVEDETAAHAIALWDRFLAAKISKLHRASEHDQEIHKSDYLKYAVSASCACFLLAAKLKETDAPCVSDLVRIVGIQPSNLHQTEADVLTALDWNIHTTTGKFHFFSF